MVEVDGDEWGGGYNCDDDDEDDGGDDDDNSKNLGSKEAQHNKVSFYSKFYTKYLFLSG